MIMQVKLEDGAKIPEFAHATDAGMDLFCYEENTVLAGQAVMVRTGISVAIPEGYVGLIWDKSGMAVKRCLKVMAGVIDSGYRGEIQVIMTSLSNAPIFIEKGMKVAQMLIQKVEQPTIQVVYDLPEADRGDAGFGSTGEK